MDNETTQRFDLPALVTFQHKSHAVEEVAGAPQPSISPMPKTFAPFQPDPLAFWQYPFKVRSRLWSAHCSDDHLRCQVYAFYTKTQERLKHILERSGFRVALLTV